MRKSQVSKMIEPTPAHPLIAARTGRWASRIALAAGLFAALSSQPASATPYTLGVLDQFALFGSGASYDAKLTPGALTVNGNVGVGQGGKAELGGQNVVVSGQVIYYDPVTSTNLALSAVPTSGFSIDGSSCKTVSGCTTNGSVVQNQTLAGSAATDLDALYAAAKGLAANSALTGITATTAINESNGSADVYVASLTSVNLSSGVTLTLTGDASDYFIFNISGTFSGSGSGKIVLNGVSADHVLFDLLGSADGGSNGAASLSGSFTGSGIILGLNSNITEDTPSGSWSGRFLSNQTIHIFSEGLITAPAQNETVPEPTSLALLSIDLAGLGLLRRRR